MIAGHPGVALGARALGPKAPLGWLLAAAIVPDLLDGGYALAGVCSPFGVYSHSLPAIAGIAGVTMVPAYALTRSGAVALVFGLMVLAHEPADWLTRCGSER